jgi:hypothetical protein
MLVSYLGKLVWESLAIFVVCVTGVAEVEASGESKNLDEDGTEGDEEKRGLRMCQISRLNGSDKVDAP